MIIVLTGPTGSGKTKMAIDLAKRIGGVIINGDAFQVYKELNIATAKPSQDEFMQAPHYLFDFIPLDESYNVAEYQLDLRACIAELNQTNTPIIIAGGTGLYIRAGLYDYEFTEDKPVDMSAFENQKNEDLHDFLKKIDPKSAEIIHPNNRVRLLRAIEIYLQTGQPKSSIESTQKHMPIYDVRFFGLHADRAPLYERVNARVDEMFASGLVEENYRLVGKYGRDRSAFKAIGVKELFPYFDGEISLEEAKENIKKNTRNYIKRQETFFKHQFDIEWISSADELLASLGKSFIEVKS